MFANLCFSVVSTPSWVLERTSLSLGPLLLYVFILGLGFSASDMCIFNHLLCCHIQLYPGVVHVTLLKEKLMQVFIFHYLNVLFLFKNMHSRFIYYAVLTLEII